MDDMSSSIKVKATITTTKDGKFTIEDMVLDNIASPNLPKIIYLKYVNGAALGTPINDYLMQVNPANIATAFVGFPLAAGIVPTDPTPDENKAIFARIQFNVPDFNNSTNIYINKGLEYKTMLTYNNANNRWDMYGFNGVNPAPYYTYLGYINNTGELPNFITSTSTQGKNADNTNLTFTIQAFA
jgi:hypothetical protein